MHRPRSFRWAALAALAAGGCAPTLVSGTMSNPARTQEKLQATQEYDIGPYKENHRYTMTLKDWTPASIGVEIKLADVAECGLPDSYTFTLVDDRGARYALQQTAPPARTTEKGRADVTLNVSTLTGTFGVQLTAASRAITIQQRPRPDVGCPALDFRWTFQ